MKASNTTSRPERPQSSVDGPSSPQHRHSPTKVNCFALAGPSDLPDPHFHAFRADLADVALTGRVIASHYAEPLDRRTLIATDVREAPSDDAESVLRIDAGTRFALLDNSLGWAWGYAGEERRVGYVKSEALGL